MAAVLHAMLLGARYRSDPPLALCNEPIHERGNCVSVTNVAQWRAQPHACKACLQELIRTDVILERYDGARANIESFTLIKQVLRVPPAAEERT